ncbi:molybdopterin molybdotransferase MoeA [Paenarthrobacter sp. Z7-10]|uniref:molybdopterin molybdotransferase MoeA n=1 Tax=Paenarthrobacter sp. Z7-10 TaxID=2787635 RepID=UPI0022A9E434|nr:gephyrin-like molybdotransferase Glp [Paenarthrobacter sp. Z7-10]
MRRSAADHQEAVRALLAGAWNVSKFDDDGPRLPLIQALGRVLSHDVHAPLSLPPFGNSQMDGYAVNASDLAEGAELVVAPTIPAGAVPAPLARGTAAPIMTGAMLPDGADAVVPIERAVPATFPDSAGHGTTVALPATVAGSFVRAAGSDVQAGGLALAAGTRLSPAHLGLAAALGLTELQVRRRPRVLLVATGDEVVLPGTALPPGKIFDANSMLLHANLLEAGAEVELAALVPDDPATLREVFRHAATGGGIDLILTTGGISAGAFEVVKQSLAGAEVEFCSVAMQPGGPQGLGTVEGLPFLGFPGNPVSGVVSFEMFLRPALSALLGSPRPRTRIWARLDTDLTSPAGKHQIRRGVVQLDPAGTVLRPAGARKRSRAEKLSGVEGPGAESQAGIEAGALRHGDPTVLTTVTPVGGSSSHLLGSLAASNAMIHLPADAVELIAGAEVEVWLL